MMDQPSVAVPDWVLKVDELAKAGLSYAKIGDTLGFSKNKVLAAHRKFRFGMCNAKFYELNPVHERPSKYVVELSITRMKVTLPAVRGVYNIKYTYKEFNDVAA